MENSQINDYLIKLHDRNGTLTPEMVVADAKREGSPLHDLFEWDLGKAATSHWLETARRLIRNVKVIVTNEKTTLKAPFFVRDPSLDYHEQGYTTVVQLRTKPQLAQEAVLEECSRAASAFRRAQEVAAAVGVEQDVADLLSRTLNLTTRVKDSV
jgi:hypothetical protein